jgi:hypothetical protein
VFDVVTHCIIAVAFFALTHCAIAAVIKVRRNLSSRYAVACGQILTATRLRALARRAWSRTIELVRIKRAPIGREQQNRSGQGREEPSNLTTPPLRIV